MRSKFKKIAVILKFLIRHPVRFFRALGEIPRPSLGSVPRLGLGKLGKILRWCWATLPRRIVSTAVIAAIVFGIVYPVFFAREAKAAWWNESWQYRQKIQLTNSTGSDLTDFQVSTTVDTAALITAGKMITTTCQDMRFTDSKGQQLDYWIEENNPGCNSATTKVWLKAPKVYSGTNATSIYMYYGNPSATASQSGDKVFEFFDDFDGSSIDAGKWDIVNSPTGSSSVSGGSLTITSSGADWWGTADTSYYLDSKNGFGSLYVTESKINAVSTGGYVRFFALRSGSATNEKHFALETDADSSNITNSYRDLVGGGANWYGEDSGIVNPGSGKLAKFVVIGDTVNAYYNGSLVNTRTVSSWGLSHVALTNLRSNPNQFDYVFVHKYASADPTASASAEEKGPGPIAYWKFDEGQGGTAKDSSSNHYDGTINNATWKPESECMAGKCLYFDGSGDNVDVNDINY
jgi:hypothetical protein